MVKRSAEARAKASGTSVEAVLAAWAGGDAVAASAVPAAVSSQEPAPTSPAAEAEPAPVAAAPVVTAVMERPLVVEQVGEPIEAAGLALRIKLASRIGMWGGLGASFLVMLFATQWLLPRASLVGLEGAYRPAADVIPGWVIVGAGLLGLATGLVLGPFSRTATGFKSPGHSLVNPASSTLLAGGAAGLLVGLLVGAIISGSGEVVEGVEGVVKVPILGAVLWTAIGWMVLGALAGTVVQFFGTPAGITEAEAEAVSAVRHRLGGAFSLPVRVLATIFVIVLPVAYSFIAFPKWAPLTGSFIAASILAFGALSTSRPNLKISRNEFLAATVGVITVIVLIVSVLAVQGGGGHAEEEGGAGASVEAEH